MNKSVYLALIGATVAQKTPFMKHRLANLHKRKLEHEEIDMEAFDMDGMDWEMDPMDWESEATTMEWDEP